MSLVDIVSESGILMEASQVYMPESTTRAESIDSVLDTTDEFIVSCLTDTPGTLLSNGTPSRDQLTWTCGTTAAGFVAVQTRLMELNGSMSFPVKESGLTVTTTSGSKGKNKKIKQDKRDSHQ